MQQIDFYTNDIFHQIDSLRDDEDLKQTILDCVTELKKSVHENKHIFIPNPNAKHDVSPEALESILSEKKEISDIRVNKISNVYVFHTTQLPGTLINEKAIGIRKKTDGLVAKRLKDLFSPTDVNVRVSGHFLYPPTGYMGWHTNLRKPGWRFYITYCEEPQKSFFRYRDPDTKEIVTQKDEHWDFRLFKITQEKPLWHSVYTDVNRWSLGYTIAMNE